jgi:hypothetical protein
VLPDGHELVNGAHAGKYGMITHFHVAGHLGIIAHDTVITHFTIVCNMAIGHNEAIAAHLGYPSVFTAPVDGYKFPDGSIVAYFNGGYFAFIF